MEDGKHVIDSGRQEKAEAGRESMFRHEREETYRLGKYTAVHGTRRISLGIQVWAQAELSLSHLPGIQWWWGSGICERDEQWHSGVCKMGSVKRGPVLSCLHKVPRRKRVGWEVAAWWKEGGVVGIMGRYRGKRLGRQGKGR